VPRHCPPDPLLPLDPLPLPDPLDPLPPPGACTYGTRKQRTHKPKSRQQNRLRYDSPRNKQKVRITLVEQFRCNTTPKTLSYSKTISKVEHEDLLTPSEIKRIQLSGDNRFCRSAQDRFELSPRSTMKATGSRLSSRRPQKLSAANFPISLPGGGVGMPKRQPSDL